MAEPVGQTDKATLQGFVADTAQPDAVIYTDEHPAYRGLPNHYAVKHSVKEYVRGQVSTQGIDSFWSMVKRGYVGTFHHYSPKHLHRYINEFAGRHQRPAAGYRGPTGSDGGRLCRQATAVSGLDCRRRGLSAAGGPLMAAANFADKTVWTGDNLDILRGLNSECVDLIYLDPPFNSNRERV